MLNWSIGRRERLSDDWTHPRREKMCGERLSSAEGFTTLVARIRDVMVVVEGRRQEVSSANSCQRETVSKEMLTTN